jgi:hypothetical protein
VATKTATESKARETTLRPSKLGWREGEARPFGSKKREGPRHAGIGNSSALRSLRDKNICSIGFANISIFTARQILNKAKLSIAKRLSLPMPSRGPLPEQHRTVGLRHWWTDFQAEKLRSLRAWKQRRGLRVLVLARENCLLRCSGEAVRGGREAPCRGKGGEGERREAMSEGGGKLTVSISTRSRKEEEERKKKKKKKKEGEEEGRR